MVAVYNETETESYNVVHQPSNYFPELSEPNPTSVQLELTVNAQFKVRKHDCVSNTFTDVQSPRLARQTTRFDVGLLNDRARAFETLGPTLTALGVDANSIQRVVDKIIFMGLRMENKDINKGRKLLPLHADVWGTITEHTNIEEDFIRRALEESELEYERQNYGMVPAKKSSVEQMLKRVIVVEDDNGEDVGMNKKSKKRRVSHARARACAREACLICLEELNAGSDASLMPCWHCFHSSCIEKWLNLSHYCPVCRFEMPAV